MSKWEFVMSEQGGSGKIGVMGIINKERLPVDQVVKAYVYKYVLC